MHLELVFSEVTQCHALTLAHTHTHAYTHAHPTCCYSVCFSVTGCILCLEVAPLHFSLKAEDDYVRILEINSLKRLEYCSGFTVEISAPACKAERRDKSQHPPRRADPAALQRVEEGGQQGATMSA